MSTDLGCPKCGAERHPSSEGAVFFVCGSIFSVIDAGRFVQAPRCVAAERDRLLKERDTPELDDFVKAVVLEARHQRARWGTKHDAGKAPADWFWLLGYLGGKALAAALSGDLDKAKHHTISAAASLANWHAALLGKNNDMRPGIEPPNED